MTEKSNLEKKISDADKRIPNASKLVKKTDYNAKICEIENKIPSIGGLATNSAPTAVENKIPVTNLVKKKKKNRLWSKNIIYWKESYWSWSW